MESPKLKKSKRGGSKPKPVCKNGHDITVVGRNSSGNCRKCRLVLSLCMCQHIAADHVGTYHGTTSACIRATEIDEDGRASWCQCMKFKLDNLAYVEQLAQERGLI